jgi:outer membrane protein assembly factor BamB
MKRMRRVVVSLMLIATAIVALAVALPRNMTSPVTRALFRSPTTRISASMADRIFRPPAGAPLAVVPPNTWYSFQLSNEFGAMSGDFATGRLIWRDPILGGPPSRRPYPNRRSGYPNARGDGLVFTTTPGGEIDCIDELSRAKLWSATAREPITRLTMSEPGTLLAADEHHLHGIDTTTGRFAWSFDVHGTVETDLLYRGGRVFVGIAGDNAPQGSAYEPLLISVDARNGQARWRVPLPHLPLGVGASESGSIYCVAHDLGFPHHHSLSAVDPSSGRIEWESADFANVRAEWESKPFANVNDSLLARPQGPAVGSDVACVALENTLYGFDASTGKRRWTWSLPIQADRPCELGWPLVHEGVVYFTVKDGAVGLDCRTGRELWRYEWRYLASSPLREERDPAATGAPMIVGNAIILPYRSTLADVVKLPSTATWVPTPAAAVAIRSTPLIVGGALAFCMLAISVIRRRHRTMISLLSVLALAMTLVAWGRSYSSRDFVGVKQFASNGSDKSETTSGVGSADGALTFGRQQIIWNGATRGTTLGDSTCPLWWTHSPPPILSNGLFLEETRGDLGLRHFDWIHRSRKSGTPLGAQAETSLTLPHWFVALILAIAPFGWLTGFWRDRRRYPSGHCPGCGYDLRESRDRCPECGYTISGKGKKDRE